MKNTPIVLACTFGFAWAANAQIISFAGGTAHLDGGGTAVPTDTMTSPFYYPNVDYYVESGVLFDFVGSEAGIIGRYYDDFYQPADYTNNSVIHFHPDVSEVVVSKVDNSLFDLNYVDLSSNTITGGGAASGTEDSYITASNGFFLKIPSTDWGLDFLSDGVTPGDGVVRLFLGSEFDDIAWFSISSTNAFCIGLDSFYIDVAAPPRVVPEPGAIGLLAFLLVGAALGLRRRRRA